MILPDSKDVGSDGEENSPLANSQSLSLRSRGT